MSKTLKQSLRKTSLSFLSLTILLAFSITLSGCGGGGGGSSNAMMPGGGSQEPMRRELMLSRINEIQATERANNSDDDVVRDILSTASNQARGRTSSALGPIVSSTTQNSALSGGFTTTRASFVAENDVDGMLQFRMKQLFSNENSTILSTNDQGASVDRLEGIPAAGWKGVEFKGESPSWRHYVDLFSDIENNEDNDYLVMGLWLRERKERMDTSNYGLLVSAGGNDPFDVNNRATGLTGTATYEGPATGLHMMKADADAAPVLDYFNAKASLTADFGDASELGTISGAITEGMTDGGVVLPELTLDSTNILRNNTGLGGNFYGDTSGDGLTGKWGGKFYGNGADPNDHPGSVAGTFGAKTADDLQAIVGAFGAHKN